MLNVPDSYPLFLARHEGLFGACELGTLATSTVAIAGVGGVGGRVAEVLARSGIGSLRLADPDVFTESNLNRQAGSTRRNLGVNKAQALAELCRDVSPLVRVETYPQGINRDNVSAFTSDAAVVVDGTDFTMPSLGLMLSREAASRSIPVVIGVEVAFAAWHSVLTGEGAFERLFGLPRTASIEALDSGEIKIPLWRWIARLPRYVDLREFGRVSDGEIDAPAIAPAVEISAALVSTDVIRIVLGQPVVAHAPRVHYVDVITGRSSVFRPTSTRFNLSALLAARSRDSLVEA